MAKKPEYLYKPPRDDSSFKHSGFKGCGYVIVGVIVLAAIGLLLYYS